MERQTLVHGVLRRHLATTLPRQAAVASSYLASYEGVTGQRWRELGHTIDQVASSHVLADRVVAAADEGYRCLHQWVGHDTGPTPQRAVG